MTASRIAFSGTDFDALAVGNGSVASTVWNGQLSRRLLLLHAITEAAADRAPAAYLYNGLGPALRLVEAARRANRSAADQVIMQPRVGAWAQRCLRQLLSIDAAAVTTETAEPALGDFGSLAAAAAFAAGIDFELVLRPTAGTATFPGFGVADVAAGSETVLARGRAGVPSVELDSGGTRRDVPVRQTADCPGWRPYRRIASASAGLRIDVLLDDVDPIRDAHGLGVTTRLSPAERSVWQARLDEAWQLLTTHHRPAATAIAEGLRCVVPIDATSQAPELSATPVESFGSIYLTQPKDGTVLATALVHEFQHTKLSALIDLVPLQARQPAKLFYAPWRADARPLSGLLQGTYAYLGLARFMDIQRNVGEPARRAAAEFEFARFRSQIWRASGSIAESGALTDPGHRFVAAMRRQIQQLRRAPVDPVLRDWAASADTDHWACWRLANLVCDENLTDWQAEQYLAGRECPVPSSQVPAKVVQTASSFRPNQRLRLTYTRLADPAAFQSMAADPTGPLPSHLADATPADVLLAAGELAEATRRYRQAVVAGPDRLDQWAGLSTARRRAGPSNRTSSTTSSSNDLLVARPELVQQVHQSIRLRGGDSADPLRLARWLAAE